MGKILTAVFALLFFVCTTVCNAYAPDGKCYVTMLDIGQGDSFLVETPTQNILIDAGDTATATKLVSQLNEAGIGKLEKIILTHPHADHIGGVNAVLNNFAVDEIFDNGIASNSPLYKKYHDSSVPVSTLKTGDDLDLGGGVHFKVFYPTPALVKAVNSKAQKSDANNESIVGKLIFGGFSMLFTGDAEKVVEDEICEMFPAQLKSTVLKAGHHGSKSSSSPDFIANVNPDYVFISAGANNQFGHPHKQPLATYREQYVLPDNILCTRFNGIVRVETDGKNQIITVEKMVDWIEDYTGEIITVTRID